MHAHRRRALTITDLLAALIVLSVLAMLAAAGLTETRRASQLDESIANLKRFATATEAYAADNAGRLWGFTWQPGEVHEWIDPNGDVTEIDLTGMNVLETGSHQAIYHIRKIEDRVGDDAIAVPDAWFAHPLYSHLPLMDYLGGRILERWIVDPGDRVRLNWQDDPANKFDKGVWLPLQPDPTPDNARWPYGSSYRQVAAAWDANQSDLQDGEGKRISQASQHNYWIIPAVGYDIFPQLIADIAYPGQKVHVHDGHQRHFGSRQPFYGLREARIPASMFDGSVSVRHSADANPGWNPNFPAAPCDPFSYAPRAWEPDTVEGKHIDTVTGRYAWTRGGLKGVDFGGLPLDTGQSNPGDCPF